MGGNVANKVSISVLSEMAQMGWGTPNTGHCGLSEAAHCDYGPGNLIRVIMTSTALQTSW